MDRHQAGAAEGCPALTGGIAEVGQPAPDFDLSDQHGQRVRCSQLRGAPALLVFFPYAFSGICSSELASLQSGLGELTSAGARAVAISVDTMFALRTFADQLGLGFGLLSDFWPHGAVARGYGVFDEQRGCAVRGSFVLDAEGIVRWSVRQEIGQAREMAEAISVCTALA